MSTRAAPPIWQIGEGRDQRNDSPDHIAAAHHTGLATALADTEGPDPIDTAAARFAELGFEGAVRELAANFKPQEYDRVRRLLAKRLEVRTVMLDRAYDHERKRLGNGADDGSQGEDLNIEDPEPWEVAVDGVRLLNELAYTFRRYAVLPHHADKALALWVLHTYSYDYRDCTPILGLTSPQKRCGKTTVISLVSELSSRALPASNITSAGVFRVISKYKPTLLIDEADTFLRENEALRGVLNSGHTRKMAYVIRPVGDDHEPKRFSTWAPKVMALIGKLPSTLFDRSINIVMQRRLPGERIEKINGFNGLEMRRKCVRWVDNYHPWIAEADPEIPSTLNDRAADNWRPLLALADLAGGRWPKRARQAALAFSGDQEDEGASILLLSDLRDLFRERGTDRLPSDDIVDFLINLEDRPWPEWGKRRKPITKNVLARLLKPFRVVPTTIRFQLEVKKGYQLKALEPVFNRYLHKSPYQNVTPLQTNNDAGYGHFQNVTKDERVTDRNRRKPNKDATCNGVTDKKRVDGEEDGFARDGLSHAERHHLPTVDNDDVVFF